MELYSVIKNNAPGDLLVSKFEGEDFNNASQLIVTESEEALFMKDGVIVQSFSGGRFTLDTKNYPFISALRNKFSGGKSPFNCRVYFVNKVHKLELFWGTDSPIQMRDAEFGFMVGVRARGSYSIQVADAKKFLLKLVGNNVNSFTSDDIETYFRSAFVMHIKTTLAKQMKEMRMTVLDMSSELTDIAERMKPIMQPIFDEYGIRLVNFYIVDISIPENDPNYEKINTAYANRGARNIEGYTWQQEQSAGILRDLANNPGAGGIGAMGAGIGMGVAAGGMFAGLANQMFSGAQQPAQPQTDKNPGYGAAPQGGPQQAAHGRKCPQCGAENSDKAKFCCECGAKLGPEKVFCTNCGAEMPANAKFCNECGAKRES